MAGSDSWRVELCANAQKPVGPCRDKRRVEGRFGCAHGVSSRGTSTLTRSEWPPPPRMTPRIGLTSPYSRPHASVTWVSDGNRLFVGSTSIQPTPGQYTASHAWDSP